MIHALTPPAPSRTLVLQGSLVLALALACTLLPLPLAALVVVGSAAALVALIFPWTVWLVLAAAIPVAAVPRLGPASPADALIAIALSLWFADGLRRKTVRLQPALPAGPILVFVLVYVAAAVRAADLGEALGEVVKWVEFAGVVLVAPLAFPDRKAEWLVAALLAATVTQAGLGLYQFFNRIGPDWFLIQGRFMRASGVFRQPNPYGGYLGLSLPVALSLSLYALSRLRQTRHSLTAWVRVVLYPAAALLIAAGLVASWSRGGWLGAVAGGITVLALYSRRTAALLGVCLLVVGLLALGGALNAAWLPTGIAARLADLPAYFGVGDVLNQPVTDDNFAVVERVAHWVAAVRMWEQHPWLGVGPGNYATAYAAVAVPRWDDPLGHAHNIYLNFLAEAGLVGLIAVAALWVALGAWVVRHALRNPDPFARALAVGVAGVLAHLVVHSVFDNLFVQGMVVHLALWLVAVTIAVDLSRSPHDSFDESEI